MVAFLGRRSRVIILVIAVAAATIAVFDAVVLWGARRERTAYPSVGGSWVLNPQVVEQVTEPRGTVILLHGFVGSPYDFSPLVRELASIGYRVDVPMLPGQSRRETLSERGQVTADDLIEWTREYVHRETRRSGSKPVLVGISMGGTLATIVGAEGLVDRLILLAPYFELPAANDSLTVAASVLKWVVPTVPKLAKGMINDPVGYAKYEPGTYFINLRGFLAVQELAMLARPVVPALKVDTLVIQSPRDRVASYQATRDLFKPLVCATIVEVPQSDHLVLFDYDSETAIEAIKTFLLSDPIGRAR